MITFGLAPGALPPGRRIYAIGDVHGHLDRLVALHGAIARDLAERPADAPLLVHLGDYIDRGPDSAGVIERLTSPALLPPLPVVNLMGNHEFMMLSAMVDDDPGAAPLWLANGGTASLHSWRMPDGLPPREWAWRLPRGHLNFLRCLAYRHQEGPYVFVHAGLRPGVPLAEQSRQDMLWLREPFLSWYGPWSAEEPDLIVVHGHTPMPDPVVRPNRIGIDTGAGMGRKLTCAVLEADRLAFMFA